MISETSINFCWEEAMRYFFKNAYSRSLCGKEYYVLDNLILQVNDYSLEESLSELCLWRERSRTFFTKQVESPGKYSELSRLYSYGFTHINQMDDVIKSIKKRKNIKPIVMQVFDPFKDNRENVPTPCITNITLDLFGDTINMLVNFSTMNLFRMGLLDFHQMSYLHYFIAQTTEKRVGSLRISILNAHMPIFDYFVGEKIFVKQR